MTLEKKDRIVSDETYEKIARQTFEGSRFVEMARSLEAMMLESEAGKIEGSLIFGDELEEYKVKIAVQIVYEP